MWRRGWYLVKNDYHSSCNAVQKRVIRCRDETPPIDSARITEGAFAASVRNRRSGEHSWFLNRLAPTRGRAD